MGRALDVFQLVVLGCFLALFLCRSIQLYVGRGVRVFQLVIGKPWREALLEGLFLVACPLWLLIVVGHAWPTPFDLVPAFADPVLLDSVAARLGGAALLLMGVALFAWSLWSFGGSWRVGVDRRAPGRLVTTGVFAWSRNPIFLSMDLILIGVFGLDGHLSTAVFAVGTALGFHRQILHEERFLGRLHGEPYAAYLGQVRRYLGRLADRPAAAVPVETTDDARTRRATRVTVTAAVVNVVLALAKLAAGAVAGSAALVADGMHSLSDLITDGIVLAGVRFARRPADESHNYGHGKIETLAAVAVGAVLLIAAGGILFEACKGIAVVARGGILGAPSPAALVVAVVSIAVKEALFRFTRAAGRQLDSPALMANAWHQRSDALSSVAVAVGVAGASLGGESWRVLDPVAASVVALLIGKVALSLAWSGLGELLEAGVDPETRARILESVHRVDGARSPHGLRARRLGSTLAVDLHVEVARHLDIVQAHAIAEAVEEQLTRCFGANTLVNVHVDPAP